MEKQKLLKEELKKTNPDATKADTVTRIKKWVEEHYDDCGTDMFAIMYMDQIMESWEETSVDHDDDPYGPDSEFDIFVTSDVNSWLFGNAIDISHSHESF